MAEHESMSPDEQWAKTYVYSPRALRIIMCPSGALALFDNCGRWIGMRDFEGVMRALEEAKGWRDPAPGPSALELPSLASSEELGF